MVKRDIEHPVLLVVLDGVGLSAEDHGNTLMHGEIPHLRRLMREELFTRLQAHGQAVGLPTDKDMGNSEVGHNALGSGQIYAQGAKLVNQAIRTGKAFQSEAWQRAVACGRQHTLHLLGLLSDGNVHSHIDHLKALIAQAKKDGVGRVAVHALLDGRDVPAQSAQIYLNDLMACIADLNDADFYAYIASGGGRMVITMDRYEADWEMVQRGWQTHVLAEGPRFPDPLTAVAAYRQDRPELIDQNMPAFVCPDRQGNYVPMRDGDACIFFNFRGDRALEISRAFEAGESFTAFDRGDKPDVFYAGMLEYDGDLHIPRHYLVEPPHIQHVLTETLLEAGIKQYAIAETQKFGHVTYFWNGNRLEPFSPEGEVWKEVPSDKVDFAEKPWMKAYDITENVIATMAHREFGFIRTNFANGDMVGHTGNYQAAMIALETVDLCLGRLVKAADQYGYTLMVLADHGNCEEMYQQAASVLPQVAKTSHTLNPVPFIVKGRPDVCLREGHFGLANVAASVALLLGVRPHSDWEEPILKLTK